MMAARSAKGLLSGLKVLELGRGVSGPCCVKVLAQLDAEVIKLEPPEGDPARKMGPFPGEERHSEKSGLFLALNMNKLGVTLGLHEKSGADKLLQLADSFDVIIDNLPSNPLDSLGLGYDGPPICNKGWGWRINSRWSNMSGGLLQDIQVGESASSSKRTNAPERRGGPLSTLPSPSMEER